MYVRQFRGILPTVAALGIAGISSAALAVPIYVIDDDPSQHLITFDSATPTALQTSVAIQGLQANEKLIGIDFRINSVTPANSNLLYGVGSFGRIYTLNPATGAATFSAALTDATTGNPVILNGTEFGLDFNPQADRLRIVSDLDQNLRINVALGANNTTVDASLTPGTSNVTNVAYDRNDISATTPTTLFGLDSVANTLVRIGGPDGTPSPNGGVVTTVGPLGIVNPINIGGFDIDSSGAGTAYAAIAQAGLGADSSILYTINLVTGTAIPVGSIGNAEDINIIKGLAVGPGPGIPEPATGVLAAGALGLLAARRRRRA